MQARKIVLVVLFWALTLGAAWAFWASLPPTQQRLNTYEDVLSSSE
jgi:hypothetical protein